MARIADSEVERLKDEVSLVRLVESAGVKLAKRGGDMVGSCPFHDDATPSFVVTVAKNLFHCFGCDAAGGPIDWVMKHQGVSFRHAVELLRDGAALEPPSSSPARSTVRRLAAPVSMDADDQALLGQVVDYYHETLKSSPEALAYLKARGLDHPELIERFRLGLADRTLGLPAAREEPQGRRRHPRPPAADRPLPGERARALHRLPRGADRERRRHRHRGLRPQDQEQPARRHADAPVPARPASRRVEPGRHRRVRRRVDPEPRR